MYHRDDGWHLPRVLQIEDVSLRHSVQVCPCLFRGIFPASKIVISILLTDQTKVKSTGQKSNNGNKERVHEVQDYYNPLELFFAQYPSFDYGREASSSQEFYRMCDTFNWDREDLERQDAHEEFKTALVKQFSQIYGTEVEDIQAWRGLCLALEILPLPGDVREAKEVRYTFDELDTFPEGLSNLFLSNPDIANFRCFDASLLTSLTWLILVVPGNQLFSSTRWRNSKNILLSTESTSRKTPLTPVVC